MKKVLMIAALMLSISLIISGAAYAATATATLDVSVSVGAACTVQTTPVDFGQYDNQRVDVFADITVTCPTGIPYAIALDAGQNYDGRYRGISNGPDRLYYILFDPFGYEWGDVGYGDAYPDGSIVSGTGDGTPQSHDVLAELPGQGYFADGVYSDTVGVTVYY